MHSFHCHLCDEEFSLEEEVTKHTNNDRHSGAFTCAYCDKTFDLPRLLEQHKKTVHPFPCAHCGRAFHKKDYLASHIQHSHYVLEDLEPPNNATGEWKLRKEMPKGAKSYGVFECCKKMAFRACVSRLHAKMQSLREKMLSEVHVAQCSEQLQSRLHARREC
jgi:hypothetical protein